MSPHERLSSFVMRTHGAGLSPAEISRPWTYIHREWVDEDGERNCECVGVSIERDAGPPLRVRVSDMQGFPP